jgi:exonuclease SbcD
VLELVDRRGERAAVALLPWLSQRYVVSADALLNRDADQHQLAYQDRVRAVVGALCQPFGSGAVNVLVGHLHALGGRTGGGERSAHTVLDYAVPGTIFPASTGYVALGHLHRTQRVDAPAPTWYPGSPLQLDFGEETDTKAVLVVDVQPGSPAVVDAVPLTGGHRLRTLEGTLGELAAQASTVGDDWLRVVVHERARAGLADDVRELFANVVDVRLAAADDESSPASGADAAPTRSGRSPSQLFADYLAERRVDDARLPRLFDELYEVAVAEERHEAVEEAGEPAGAATGRGGAGAIGEGSDAS